jgi:hypothetical protein
MRKLLALILLLCSATSGLSGGIQPVSTSQARVFVLVFSITNGGSTINSQAKQEFPTKKECLADRAKLIEAFRIAHPPTRPGDSITAHCERVKR